MEAEEVQLEELQDCPAVQAEVVQLEFLLTAQD